MNIKKIILAIAIIIFLGFSTQTQAVWYDWFWKGKKEIPVETKNQSESKSSAIQVAPTKSEPISNTQKSVTEIESLKSEVATLKVSLDNLYKAHSRLLESHNKLLKYTTEVIASIRSELKNTTQAPTGSNLEAKVTSLEKKIEDVCAQIFSSFSGFGTKCPSQQFLIRESLEYRIKKLEGGY